MGWSQMSGLNRLYSVFYAPQVFKNKFDFFKSFFSLFAYRYVYAKLEKGRKDGRYLIIIIIC